MKIFTDFLGEKQVLDVLSHQEEMPALDILNKMNQNRKGMISHSLVYVYCLLNRLEKKGLVQSRLDEERSIISGARRRYYKSLVGSNYGN